MAFDDRLLLDETFINEDAEAEKRAQYQDLPYIKHSSMTIITIIFFIWVIVWFILVFFNLSLLDIFFAPGGILDTPNAAYFKQVMPPLFIKWAGRFAIGITLYMFILALKIDIKGWVPSEADLEADYAAKLKEWAKQKAAQGKI